MNTMDQYDLIQAALADMGTIHRRASAQTLTEEDFRELMGRARRHLIDLRELLIGLDEPEIELTDAGRAALANSPRRLDARALLARIPGLMMGRDVPSPSTGRMRAVTQRGRCLGVIDGGRA